MGLIKALMTATGSTLADEWKEYIYVDSMPSNVIVAKGHKKNDRGSSNTKGSDNIISTGSIIAINNGQAMAIVEDGKVIEYCDEPGKYEFNSSTESSFFSSSSFKEGIKESFAKIGRRTTFGGSSGHDQRVYFFNLKEILDCKFGTSEHVMYDDPIYQYISLRFFGNAVIKLVDPIKFYTNVCGNVSSVYKIDEYWQLTLKNEFIEKLSTAMAKLAIDGVKFSQIPQNQDTLATYMNQVLDEEWTEQRGLIIQTVAIASVSLDPDDKVKVDKIDEMRLLSDPRNASGRLVSAQANAMETAAGNTAGAMTGFMGMGFANQSGGININDLYSNADKQKNTNAEKNNDNSWTCSCGAVNTGKFCNECGAKKPESPSNWTCECGTSNVGKFCSDCGAKKIESPSSWTCECGTSNTGKFCSNCGKTKL